MPVASGIWENLFFEFFHKLVTIFKIHIVLLSPSSLVSVDQATFILLRL